ncbi:MAG: cytochrome P460 family protein [Owenweeksia sp.]
MRAFKILAVLIALFLFVFFLCKIDHIVRNDIGSPSPLPLPSTLPLDEYEKQLYTFLDSLEYERLGWKRDKSVRNTGPYVDGKMYGVHPAVVIYYSPEVIEWLKGGREGEIPDGAMIVKVMYSAPAQRYVDLSMEEVSELIHNDEANLFDGWTVMVKDKSGSKDGWFWSYYAPNQPVDPLKKYPFDYPNSGFGNYCIRCHASAEKEFTFSSLSNIEGEPGTPISYYVDNSWEPDSKGVNYEDVHEKLANALKAVNADKPEEEYLNEAFLRTYREMKAVAASDVKHFPPETYDHVVSGPNGPGQFLTADQCISCHDGQTGHFLPNMTKTVGTDSVVNVSPYGEWRWSMMGLAGRDPIFFAQLESEKAIHNQGNLPNTIENLCFSCHGVMGQRQFHIDNPSPDSLFREEIVYHSGKGGYDMSKPYNKYGALARDGISCMSCHQIIDDGKSLKEIETGKFVVSAPGEVHGPFENPPIHAMDNGLGVVPKYSSYIGSSRLCGSCHTINLPVFDAKGEKVGMHYEQATYLEWLNSAYQDEYEPVGKAIQTCQDCHMPSQYPFREGEDLAFKIANIQDQDYPEADHLAAPEDITLETRSDFRRHTLLGINLYALEMFRQFDDVLGVRQKDYMTGLYGLDNAISSSNRLAKKHSVKVEIEKVDYSTGTLNATVKLTNLVGHRFPSGVGFRRAFLQFAVISAAGDTLWASGRANEVGVIVDAKGEPLPSEFLERNKQGVQQYEPHYHTISRQDQVQIYQELTKNPEGEFTTSFVSIAEVVKDNRLLPLGWSAKGPEGFDPDFAEATMPHGKSLEDKLYMSGQGLDAIVYQTDVPGHKAIGGKVVATLYYQSIPPYYLQQRFETAKGEDGKRLYYLASHLNTKGTPVENWKLATGSAEKTIR